MEARGVPLKDDAPMPLAKGGDAELERGHLVRVTVRFGFGFGFGFGSGTGLGFGLGWGHGCLSVENNPR